MGFTPQQVNAMSVWQFQAVANGYAAANSPKTSEKLTDEEADALFDWIDGDGLPSEVSTPVYRWSDIGFVLDRREVLQALLGG